MEALEIKIKLGETKKEEGTKKTEVE